jgi:UDP-N-acetylmuramoyl-tripeptide--D-alanyl-D-alanine ligase
MKSLFRSLIAWKLAVLSRMIIRKYQPTIVMVTGSVGKTSTKDAVAAALTERFLIRKSEKSYNSEFGVPFTIIGVGNPWTSIARWMSIFWQAWGLILLPSHYPSLLVLEVGADRPGDLARILRIALPDAVVVTKLPEVPVHVEAYATPAAVREEEFAPAYALAPGMPLVVSKDDPFALDMAKTLPMQLVTYGYEKGADVALGTPSLHMEGGIPTGMEAAVTVAGKSYTLEAQSALGRQQLYAPAAALAIATALGMTAEEALEGLRNYMPPPGRSRILEGKDGVVLVDDSYNASPTAMEEALGALSLLPGTRRIAVLGDMLELGRFSVEEHERVGKHAATSVDMLVAVGVRARAIAEAARTAGMPSGNALMFDTSMDAAHALRELVQAGDVVLIKGSQGVRMERIVEALLRNPAHIEHLVRQDTEWKKKK